MIIKVVTVNVNSTMDLDRGESYEEVDF